MKTKYKNAEKFGDRLWTIMQEKDISYEDIAEALDVTVRIVYCYVNGEKMPTPEKFWILTNYLNVSAKDLLSF